MTRNADNSITTNKIELIKMVRTIVPNISLLEAKNNVESYMAVSSLPYDQQEAINTVKHLITSGTVLPSTIKYMLGLS